MSRTDEEKCHLLADGINGDGGEAGREALRGEQNGRSSNGQLFYDSFPHIGTPIDDGDDDGLVKAGEPTKAVGDHDTGSMRLYKRRWYILIMYSLFAMTQNGVWNTWGPISSSSEEAFGWHDSTIAWLNNWGPIAYILLGLFFPWLLQVKGLRWAVVSSMVLTAIGAGLRCITSEPGTATILIHIGHFFNGAAGPIAMGAIPTLSATWFPPKERVTATALGSAIGVFGVALSFVLGPALVPESPPKHSYANLTNLTAASTTPASLSLYFGDKFEHQHTTLEPANVTDARIKKERDQIMWYMYYEGIWSLVICLVILIYFPAKPPHPPCVSAEAKRDEYWAGMWSLRRKGYFLVVALVYGISLGVVNCWSSVLYVNLKTIGVSEDTAGWIGFYATLAACAGSLFIGRFANQFARRMQLFILVLYAVGTACFAIFTLMLIKVIPYSDALLWSTIIGGTMLINAAVPLMFELACELAYPTSEGAANGVLTYINNVGGLFFLLVFSFPNVGTMWMNWAVIGSCFVCIPLIGLLKGRFHRLEVDEGVHTEVYVEQTMEVNSDSNSHTDLLRHSSVQA